MPSNDELWDLYADAVIHCEVDGRAITLRGPGAGVLPAAVPLFVLTAYNPNGIAREHALNEAAQEDLEADVRRRGALGWPATGRSRDASWSEPGVAVSGFDRAAACELGRRYDQLAVFELAPDELHVVRCADDEIVRTRPRRE
jgi:hypothetical protein